MITNIKKSITIVSALLLANVFCGYALAAENKKEQSSPINQNLLMPNESVNSMTDIGKARSVYNLRKVEGLRFHISTPSTFQNI